MNARTRGLLWELSFAEFKALWKRAGGLEALQNLELSINRKDVNVGYVAGNVEIMPVALNVEVWWNEDRWQVDFRWRARWAAQNHKSIEDCPF